jgi:DNA-binding SARP family transcriptional activator
MAAQYGIRIRLEPDMEWNEFCNLLSGLLPDTPLGQIVAIRSETDRDTIKKFTPDQRRIYTEWKQRAAKKKLEDEQALDESMASIEALLARTFGQG